MKRSKNFITKRLMEMNKMLESEIRDYSGKGEVFIRYGKRTFNKMYNLEDQFKKQALLLNMEIYFFSQRKEVLVQKVT